jgi:hypothetical protein
MSWFHDIQLRARPLESAGAHVTSSMAVVKVLRIASSTASYRSIDAPRNIAPDEILSNFSMPGYSGIATPVISREMCRETPFISL